MCLIPHAEQRPGQCPRTLPIELPPCMSHHAQSSDLAGVPAPYQPKGLNAQLATAATLMTGAIGIAVLATLEFMSDVTPVVAVAEPVKGLAVVPECTC